MRRAVSRAGFGQISKLQVRSARLQQTRNIVISNDVALTQVFRGSGMPMRRMDFAVPSLRNGEITVTMRLSTICGSDLHTIQGHRQEPTPLILGHEGVGVVTDSQRAISNVTVGDRVTWSIADSCGHCTRCVQLQMPHKCKSLFKYGHAPLNDGCGLNGTYSTHVVLRPGTHVVRLPDHLSDEVAAPVNCALATVCNALDREALASGPNETAVVQGAGLLGLYSCAWLRYQLGFKHVFCVDPNLKRLELAAKFGATPLPVHEGKEAAAERREKVLKVAPEGADLVVEVAGNASVVAEGVSLLRFGGHYSLVGMVHPQTQLSAVTGEALIRRCVSVRGSHNYAPRHLDQAVAFVSRHVQGGGGELLPFESLVSPPFQLSDIDAAIEEAKKATYPRVSIAF